MRLRRQDVLFALMLFIIGVALVRLTSPARVIITWETASEVDAAGFHLYRAVSPEAPFERITAKLIPTEGDPLTGASYTYEDEDVRWGERYYYQLEEVTLSGATNRYPDIVESRAGLGWGWATGAGALLALMSLGASRWPVGSDVEDTTAEEDAS